MEVRISWASPLFAPGVAGFDSLKLSLSGRCRHAGSESRQTKTSAHACCAAGPLYQPRPVGRARRGFLRRVVACIDSVTVVVVPCPPLNYIDTTTTVCRNERLHCVCSPTCPHRDDTAHHCAHGPQQSRSSFPQAAPHAAQAHPGQPAGFHLGSAASRSPARPRTHARPLAYIHTYIHARETGTASRVCP